MDPSYGALAVLVGVIVESLGVVGLLSARMFGYEGLEMVSVITAGCGAVSILAGLVVML